jgi:transcriptional regulator with XRE-family HTH domain
MVSQIERNRVSPSIDTLLLLAEVLDIDFEHLFSDYRQQRRVSIVRRSDRRSTRHNKVALYQLSATDAATMDHAIDAFLLEIDAEGEKGDREYGHTGREFGIILQGRAELIYGNETYQLDEGDSVSFQSDIPHLFKNAGDDILKAVWIVTPPRKIRS